MPPRPLTAATLRDALPRRGTVWLSSCSAESPLVMDALAASDLDGLTFTSIFVPGLNRLDRLLAAGARIRTYFMLPELAHHPERVEFLPLSYHGIRRHLAMQPPDAMLLTLAPPDAAGRCSFGSVTDFAADLCAGTPQIVAHLNPDLPVTRGTPGVPFGSLAGWLEGAAPLPASEPGSDPVSERIAAHAARFIPDGATLQAGIGRTPEAVLRGLTGHRGLALHSGLIGDSALHLLDAGALRPERPITAGVAIGTRALYDAISGEAFTFRPPSHTHDARVLAGLSPLVTINSAIEVDLAGQVFAEATPKGPVSGPGGASDFAAGARTCDGLRIVVLPSTAAKGAVSKIVPVGAAAGPMSLGRFDTDVIVTEHGAADLRGLDPQGRARALAGIADPAHRDRLLAAAAG